MNIKKILVPVDFSSHSAEAVRFAADLSRRYEASLELIHAFYMQTYALPEGYVVPTPEQFDLVVQQLEGQLVSAKNAALEAGASSVETRLLQGRPTSEILRVAREDKIDLIVMGTHGRTGLKHLWIGSVAENVVRHAVCPVLTVRGQS
jgi:nucleotide-binding universal stress UspA family protein